jgi:hypothetical protein
MSRTIVERSIRRLPRSGVFQSQYEDVIHASRVSVYGRGVASNGKVKAATPWGSAELVDELTLPQRAGERRFVSVVQLLEAPRGELLIRFAYSTGGTARRGPVTLRARDLERLRSALGEHPRLAEVLRLGG